MMKFTRAIAVLAVVSLWAVQPDFVAAQGALKEPANLPPAGYKGSQFVDGNGCAFIRAGAGANVIWVPRVTRDRRQVCGFQPTFAQQQPRSASTAPRTVEVIGGSAATQAPAKPAKAPKRRVVSAQPGTAGVGTVVTATTAASKGVSQQARVLLRHVYEERAGQQPVKIPKGYRRAWKDDRLNPRRAEQTLAGDAQMRAMWTDTVPRRARN